MTNEHDTSLAAPLVEASFDRRGLFRIGGITVAAAALMAACGESEGGELGRVGNGVPTPTLLDPIVNDSVLLRTSASIETSIADAYDQMLEGGYLTEPSFTYPDLGNQDDMVTAFSFHHRRAAETFNSLAEEAGGDPWECGNPRLNSAYIDVVFSRVLDGVPASGSTPAIPPSDDVTRDMINLVTTLELLSASSCQALMPQVTQSSYRAEAMRIGGGSSRQGALVSLRCNPGVYTPPLTFTPAGTNPTTTTTTLLPATTTTVAESEGEGDAAPPQTEIPLPIALPTQFGSLAPFTYIGGHGDENGVRLKLNFETPSLNSFVYPFDSCAEG